MKTLSGLLCCVWLLGSLLGQETPQDLTKATFKHDEQVRAIDTAKELETEKLMDNYLKVLAASEAAASKAGKIEEVAALIKTRKVIAEGGGDAKPPEGLNKRQIEKHEEYFESLAALEKRFAPQYERVNSEYLKSLAAIEARLPAGSPHRQQVADLKSELVTGIPAEGAGKLTNGHFDNTEWLWQADRDKVWKFLPDGKITTDTGVSGHFGWKILGPDTFAITVEGSNRWKFKMDFDKMRADGVHISNPKDTKELVFKRKVSR